MMIMVLHPTKLTGLLITGICVLSMGIALSFAMHDAESRDILGARAACAAVLVVFVSTNNTTSGLSNGVVGAIAGGVLEGIGVSSSLWDCHVHQLHTNRDYLVGGKTPGCLSFRVQSLCSTQ